MASARVSTPVRAATPDDVPAITAVAMAAGQDQEWTGADPAYLGYLLAHGRLAVAVRDGSVLGFGATRQIGGGPAAVTMLCDLFVDPRGHGSGAGRAILTSLWDGPGSRMTFSSLHGLALPLYTSFGLDAWWPLLFLAGAVRALSSPAGWTTGPATPEEVSALESQWTGVDRTVDHRAWAARPGGMTVLARRDGQVLAAATVAGAGDEHGLVHLSLAPLAGDAADRAPGSTANRAADRAVGDAVARDAVIAVLAALDPPAGTARAWLPAPHPAVRPLLRSGWRTTDLDLFMATEPGLLDPRRAVPHPGLA
jgi:hypothetical protein